MVSLSQIQEVLSENMVLLVGSLLRVGVQIGRVERGLCLAEKEVGKGAESY